MTAFADLLTPVAAPESRRAAILPEFLQGRAAFGGLVAALGVRAMRAHVEEERVVRSVLVSLVAPVTVGAVTIDADLLRAGGTASHVQAAVRQGNKLCAMMLGSFGIPRRSSLSASAPPGAPDAPPGDLPLVPFIPGLTPEFTQFFEYRWPEDTMPFSGRGHGILQGWIRLKEAIPVADPFLAALGDAWPTPALPMLTRFEVFSTLTWSLELCGRPPLQASDEWWQVRASVEQAREGYVNQEMRIWTRDGRPALVSRQVVAVFASGDAEQDGAE